jgi:hypothetical protein
MTQQQFNDAIKSLNTSASQFAQGSPEWNAIMNAEVSLSKQFGAQLSGTQARQ